MTHTRLYDFETVYNFRDFGAYPTRHGVTVAPRRLFRAAHLADTGDSDLARIADLDIDLVVDLRYAPERERQPNRFWANGPAAHFEFAPVEASVVHQVAPHEIFIERDLHTADDARRYMLGSYAARPLDPGFVHIFARTLRHMARTGNGTLIHCAAGKDRTGTLAALILAVLGVDRDTIMDDYMLTMTAVDVDALLEPAAQRISARVGRGLGPEPLRPLFGVEPDYLQASLDTMGDIDAYISKVLDISPKEKAALRAAYLSG